MYNPMYRRFPLFFALLTALPIFSALCTEIHIRIVLENHLFTPSKIVVPKHTKVILDIQNNDAVYEKFSSFGLNREKILFPHKVTRLYLSPLPEGEYTFLGEFHPASARGVVFVQSLPKDCQLNEAGENACL